MGFTSGYKLVDILYTLIVFIGFAIIIFKPFKNPTEEEKRAKRKIIGSGSKAGGKTGYYTQGDQDLTINLFIYGFLVSFFLFALPLIIEEIRLL